jgi:hypothetical protein
MVIFISKGYLQGLRGRNLQLGIALVALLAPRHEKGGLNSPRQNGSWKNE